MIYQAKQAPLSLSLGSLSLWPSLNARLYYRVNKHFFFPLSVNNPQKFSTIHCFDTFQYSSFFKIFLLLKFIFNTRRHSISSWYLQDLEDVESLDPVAIAGDILASHDEDKDGFITAEEFQVWAVKNSLPDEFSKLLFQVKAVKWLLVVSCCPARGRLWAIMLYS